MKGLWRNDQGLVQGNMEVLSGSFVMLNYRNIVKTFRIKSPVNTTFF